MIYYVMCCVMLYVMSWYIVLCYVIVSCQVIGVVLCHGVMSSHVLCYVMVSCQVMSVVLCHCVMSGHGCCLCHCVMSSHVLCYVMSWCVMASHVLCCHVMVCHGKSCVVLCHGMSSNNELCLPTWSCSWNISSRKLVMMQVIPTNRLITIMQMYAVLGTSNRNEAGYIIGVMDHLKCTTKFNMGETKHLDLQVRHISDTNYTGE